MSTQRRSTRSYGFTQHAREKKSNAQNSRTKKQYQRKSSVTREPISFSWLTYLWKIPATVILFFFSIVKSLWEHRPKTSNKTKKYMKKKIISIGVISIGLFFIIGTIFVAWVSKDLPDPNKLTDRQIAQSTKIYDRTGDVLLYEIFADQKRTSVELDTVSKDIVNGVIATEDTKFYEHKGIRPLSILRAVIVGLLPGNRIQGTSTLTQQLVKNAILTNERSITRKLKEAILSIRLEQKYTKDQILKIFFNEIPYGSTNYGVESAAQSYFGKSANDVNLQEAATLAGLPKAPSTYLRNKDALKIRRDFVLRRMYEEGYITNEEKDAAQAEPLTLSQDFGEIKAPHFVLHVRDQLIKEFGEQVVDTGGLRVITTLDWQKQLIAEDVFENKGTEVLTAAEANNASLVAIDPKNGQVLSLIGSKDFYDESIDGQFNVAILGRRQPGSSFKPIVYAAAFEKGYTPETVLYDVVTDFGANAAKSYRPLNYDLSEHGPVSIRKALQGSLNIPAVKTLYLVGEQSGIDFAKRIGYSTFGSGDFGLSLVLGGGEVKPIEHIAAFGVFANNGVYQSSETILSVTDPSGDVLYEWKDTGGKRVIDSAVAATISNVLSDDAARAYAFGSNSILTLGSRPVAAKTGTTNRYIDGWTVGYTPSLVTGVWTGNTDNTPMKAGYGGSRVAGPIWNEYMTRSLADTPIENFPAAPENTATKPALRGTASGGITVKVNTVTGNLASSSTPERFIEEKTFIQAHSILHYVQKDNPRGATPENPESDPQYSIWEAAITDWVTRKKESDPEFSLEFGDAPTEVDDVYDIELIPTLSIVYPVASSTVSSTKLYTDVRVSAPRGVSVVRYYLNDTLISVEANHPFNLEEKSLPLVAGKNILTVEVEDDVGNRLRENVPFFYQNE